MIVLHKTFTIVAGGGTDTLDLSQDNQYGNIIIEGTATLSSNYTINTTGTPVLNQRFIFIYRANITLGSNTVTILGTSLTQEEASTFSIMEAVYNGSSWNLAILRTLRDGVDGVYPLTMSTGGTVVINALIRERIIILTGSPTLTSAYDLQVSNAVEGDTFEVYYFANATTNSNSVTILGKRVLPYIAQTGIGYIRGVYDGSSWQTVIIRDRNNNYLIDPQELNARSNTYTMSFPVSFETGEQCDNKIKMFHNGEVQEVYAIVTKAIAATDSATITCKNDGGTTMTGGVLTFPASSTLNTTATGTISANNTFVSGDELFFTSAKTTVGGKALITIKILKT
jgi:hypothetical protein